MGVSRLALVVEDRLLVPVSGTHPKPAAVRHVWQERHRPVAGEVLLEPALIEA